MTFKPSSLWTVALTGQTVSHGAFSQCWHIIGSCTISGSSGNSPLSWSNGFSLAIIAIDPQPVHRAAVGHLQFADDRNIVFALAGNDAGAAASADIQIDRHAPLLGRLQRRMSVKLR